MPGGTDFQKLLDKKVTRKQFLRISGLLLLSLFGILDYFKSKSKEVSGSSEGKRTFGSGPYGG
ncbi:MAG TPA: hypothetical protein VJ227_00490 [Patescibacteria group bacterium]|nr:hypothetical protein [Patescibacteria group bacterium]